MDLVSFGKTAPINTSAGVGNKTYFAEANKDLTLATPIAVPTTPEEKVEIDGDHVFDDPLTQGWSVGQHKNRKSSYEVSDEADTDVNAATHTHTCFFPDHPRIAGICEMKAAKDFIVLVGDKDCAAPKLQMGTDCNPAYIKSWRYGKGNYEGSEAKGYYITFEVVQAGMLYYDGQVDPVLEESVA